MLLGGGGEDPSGRDRGGQGQTASEAKPASRDEASANAASEAAPPPAPAETTAPPAASEDGVALNDEGKALIDAGDPAGAIPLLERAVAALEGSGDELTYNYALFNLGNALRLAGRPEEAIKLLEERLRFPDQREAVLAELAAAQQAAGGAPPPPGEGPAERPDSGGAPVAGDDGPPYGNAYGHDED